MRKYKNLYFRPFFSISSLRNTKISHLERNSVKYDYSSFNERTFLEDFNKMNFNYINDASDVDTNYDKL